MDEVRRALLGAGLVGLAAAVLPFPALAENPSFDPIPPRPQAPTPGKVGDFNFLAGEWRIAHRMIKPGSKDEWIEFEGEATCWTILAGVGSVEELRIPARDFSGMGLRMLDVKERIWSDFWVNAKSGVLTSPGQTGSFENGAGIFMSDYEEDGRKMISAGIWDRITATSCRWRQAGSADGGKTWDQSWIMDWRRI
jgi:hypothetical protein